MARWINLQRIEKLVNQMQLYITCEKFGDLHLAEPGLTAGWLSVRPSGRQNLGEA